MTRELILEMLRTVDTKRERLAVLTLLAFFDEREEDARYQGERFVMSEEGKI